MTRSAEHVIIFLSEDKVGYTLCPADIPDGLGARECFVQSCPWIEVCSSKSLVFKMTLTMTLVLCSRFPGCKITTTVEESSP